MCKPFFVIAAVLMITNFSSCSLDIGEGNINSVNFFIDPFGIAEEDSPSPPTRTSIVDGTNSFLWAPCDTVGIYPNSGSQIYFVLDIGADASSASFDGGGWDFKSSATYYSYYPFIGNIYLDRTHIPVSYQGQKQVGTSVFSHIGTCDFMYTLGTNSDSGNLSFRYHHLSCLIRLRIVLPGGTYTKVALTSPEPLFTTKGYYDLTSPQPIIVTTEYSKQLSIDLTSVTTSGESAEFVVYLMTAPVNLKQTGFIVSVLNDQRKEYQCSKTTSNIFEAGNLYKFGCTNFTEVPQSMGLIIDDWGDGGSYEGEAD